MILKFVLNIFYNITILVCLWFIYAGFTKGHYEWCLAALFLGALIIVLKIRLIKQVRNENRSKL
jgi:hypothetical protein